MKQIKNIINFVIVSLDDRFSKNVSIELSSKMDMYNADVKELIAYQLINPKEILQKCGYEYLKSRERDIVRGISEFENTVMSMSFNLFKEYNDIFKNSIIIYLKLPKGKTRSVLNEISYEARDEYLHRLADIELYFERKSKINATKLIIEKLREEL